MPGRLAVDFGTSNTVVAVWDEAQQQGIPLHIPDFGLLQRKVDARVFRISNDLKPSRIDVSPLGTPIK